MRTLIKDGTVVSASDSFVADVWIEDGKIVGMTHPSQRGPSQLGSLTADLTVDAKGQYVITEVAPAK